MIYGGGLEVLQAVLLLANFALLRPVPPGLWYITGVAVRLAVDLRLHHENDGDGWCGPETGAQEGGRRLWMRDMRRRLWWCTYSLDRLVSTCVGRPFGISDQVITTELPSLVDDDYLTPSGFISMPESEQRPSYKRVAHHYFRLRRSQSEMLQVLSYNQTRREKVGNSSLFPRLPSPFLGQFASFFARGGGTWMTGFWSGRLRRRRGARRAWPFSTHFLELNYWQAIVMLYRQCLSVPVMFEGEYNTSDGVDSPTAYTAELREDEDHIYVKVAEAGQKIVRIYRQLHLGGLVSYTYLSTHHLFMAGISYLYAIWHSPVVRAELSMDEVNFTVLAAKSVFTDMIDKCPPAETCRDAFDRTAKATIKMASSSGGFGGGREPGPFGFDLSPGTGEWQTASPTKPPPETMGQSRDPSSEEAALLSTSRRSDGAFMGPPHFGVAQADYGLNGGVGVDPTQLDLDFGIDWEGGRDDFGEGQQTKPFDAFFFGGGGGGISR
ncbi:hypothetical protein XA68_18335 [Ophiocordyceps unilateralis]|uniref:Xylanolytic transcriptional activator regulatory domain-containing protein n=1 Tax=Ophiocordyceps unilateralis TaxID=268505 RepID=A0A2A9P2N6_OPHUN|nr:hypothetical protein XA68_18335 [Ophiocordyceps unilateralis]